MISFTLRSTFYLSNVIQPDSMLELFQYLNNIYPLSAEMQSYLMQVLRRRELPANYYWLREEEVCTKVTFIEKGLMKLFYTLEEREIITGFKKEYDIAISVTSFFKQLPSRLSIRTIEPTVVSYIELKEIEYIYKRHTDFNINARKITERYYCTLEEHLMLMYLPPKERFIELMKQHTWMSARIKDKHLAAYIGISNVAFSKFKNALRL